jgi:hypothetical protein
MLLLLSACWGSADSCSVKMSVRPISNTRIPATTAVLLLEFGNSRYNETRISRYNECPDGNRPCAIETLLDTTNLLR